MKNLLKTITVVITALAFTLNANAQEDKITGIYVDGVKVTEIDCYSFREMEVIINHTPIWDQYPEGVMFFVWISKTPDAKVTSEFLNEYINQNSVYMRKILTDQELKFKYTKDELIRYKIFEKGIQEANGDTWSAGNTKLIKRQHLNYFDPKRKLPFCETDSAYLNIGVYGSTIKGYNEEFDPSCNCIKKSPTFKRTPILDNWITIKIKNRKQEKYNYWKETWPDVDLSSPCLVLGPKLEDFNKTGKTTSVKTNNNVQSTNSTNVSTTNTKPYTEKHKNGKIAVQGQFDANGQHEGTWKYFTEAGKVERIENYKGGIMHGEWKYFDEAGKLTKTEKYNEGELIE